MKKIFKSFCPDEKLAGRRVGVGGGGGVATTPLPPPVLRGKGWQHVVFISLFFPFCHNNDYVPEILETLSRFGQVFYFEKSILIAFSN